MNVEHRGYSIQILQDESPENPREAYSNLGKMVCFHNRYQLGDKHALRSADFSGWGDIKSHLEKTNDIAVILPIYMYDHGGLALSTNRSYPFDCPWDSGQVGWIFVTKAELRYERGIKRLTKAVLEAAEVHLAADVATYSMYLSGNVYGYVVTDQGGNEVDSCWGIYGLEEALTMAKEFVDDHTSEQHEVLDGELAV